MGMTMKAVWRELRRRAKVLIYYSHYKSELIKQRRFCKHSLLKLEKELESAREEIQKKKEEKKQGAVDKESLKKLRDLKKLKKAELNQTEESKNDCKLKLQQAVKAINDSKAEVEQGIELLPSGYRSIIKIQTMTDLTIIRMVKNAGLKLKFKMGSSFGPLDLILMNDAAKRAGLPTLKPKGLYKIKSGRAYKIESKLALGN